MVKISSEDITLDFLKFNNGKELIIAHNNETFYMKVYVKDNSKRLAVHTNGAIDYTIKTPPVYQRSSWASNIEANTIFLDDKTLHYTNDKKFNTAWLIGTKDRHFVYDYSEIIKIVQKEISIEDKEVYYWGSSAGGTAAIKLATLHKSSTAVANNPQTNILTDNKRRRDAIFRNVFPDMTEEEAIEKYYHVLTLPAFMKYNKYVPRIFYIQNNAFETDLKNHYYTFLDELKSLELNIDHKLTVWLYHDSVRGHSPLLPDKTHEYLHTIMSFKHL